MQKKPGIANEAQVESFKSKYTNSKLRSRVVENNGQALFEPESLTSEFLGVDNTTGEGAEFSQVAAY